MQNSYSSAGSGGRMQETDGQTGLVTYAGFWVRLAAYAIDSLIVFAGLLIVRLVMAGVMGLLGDTVLGGDILFHYTLKDIVLYIAQVLYFILCTYYTGTTLGKRAMNLRVVRPDGQKKLPLMTVIYRETVGRFLSGIILWVGYIMIGIDQEKRGLHDILCDTRVIYAKRVKLYPVFQRPLPPYAIPTPYMHPGPQMPPQKAQGEETQKEQFGRYHMVHPQEQEQEESKED